jgi:hypothetical protein
MWDFSVENHNLLNTQNLSSTDARSLLSEQELSEQDFIINDRDDDSRTSLN